MWNKTDESLSDLNGYQIRVGETLLWYDGPMIFLTKIFDEQFLFCLTEENEGNYLYIGASITDEVLSLLKKDELSLLGVLKVGDFRIFSLDAEYKIDKYWQPKIEDVDQIYLPDPGVALYSYEKVPDSVA